MFVDIGDMEVRIRRINTKHDLKRPSSATLFRVRFFYVLVLRF